MTGIDDEPLHVHGLVHCGLSAVHFRPGKDEPAGCCLQGACNAHVHRAADLIAAVVDHHHRAVVEIAYALTGLLARLHQPYLK